MKCFIWLLSYTAEVLLLENEVIVFKSGSDCKFYVCGTNDENELILLSVLEAVYDAVYSLMKGQVEKRTMLDNLELILLTIDETVSGIIELIKAILLIFWVSVGSWAHHGVRLKCNCGQSIDEGTRK